MEKQQRFSMTPAADSVNVGSVNKITIGQHELRNNLFVAPMAGVTDRPFRQLCKRLGAGMAVSEMITANAYLYGTKGTERRANHEGEAQPKSIQIAGGDPVMLAETARLNEDRGAQIIDINMGCPAKKICNKAAGSALLKDEAFVAEILDAVVSAVKIPVTLKIRTGWDPRNRNGVRIARIAEDAGIKALAVHGRTRACRFKGEAEYETIRQIKAEISIPVIANGDVDTPEKAKWVLEQTGADGLMIGRPAQGNPWIFREIDTYLKTGQRKARPSYEEILNTLIFHLKELHEFYGEHTGVRVARKHISWYTKGIDGCSEFRNKINKCETRKEQLHLTRVYFNHLIERKKLAA